MASFKRAVSVLGLAAYGTIYVLGTIFSFLMAWLMVALLVGILFFGLQIPSGP